MTKKSTTKTVTIRTIWGNRLRLTPTRLLQVDHSSARPWFTSREEIRRAVKNGDGWIPIHEVGTGRTLTITFSLPRLHFGAIGCCVFDKTIFNQILRYFGVRKTKALAAKAGA